MPKELKDNTNFETNIDPPVPPAPHFDLKRIEAAKPVQPLPNNRWLKMRGAAQRKFRGRLGLFAIVTATVLIMIAVAAWFIDFRPAPQAANDTSLSKENNFAESTPPEAAPVSIERPQTRFSRAEPRHRTNSKTVQAWEAINLTSAPSNGKPKARLVAVIH